MCKICNHIRDQQPRQDEVLYMIGEAMTLARTARQVEHLNDLLDRVLGTEMDTQDDQANEEWEKGR